jgi:gluconate 2-dehydrogenase alpha chain
VQNYGNRAAAQSGTVSWRFHEDDFRTRSQTIERYGAAATPADSSLVDWPSSYADLEPYYAIAAVQDGQVHDRLGELERKWAGT